MDEKVAAAHEAGHWAALHALGIDSLGIEFSRVDPAPACNRLRYGPGELSLHDRRLVAFAGVAGELVALGARDYNHWLADAAVWLPEADFGEDPEGRAVALLEGKHAAFLGVYEGLRAQIGVGLPLSVPTSALRIVAERSGASLGWYVNDPRFELG